MSENKEINIQGNVLYSDLDINGLNELSDNINKQEDLQIIKLDTECDDIDISPIHDLEAVNIVKNIVKSDDDTTFIETEPSSKNINQESDDILIGGEKKEEEDNLFDTQEEIINNPLINKDKVRKLIRKYIDNYNNKKFTDYKNGYYTKELFNKVGKSYHLLHKNNSIYLVKTNNKSIDQLNNKNISNYVMKVKQPKYIYIKEELKKLNNIIKSEKQKLDSLYLNLKSKNKHTKDEINSFTKLKSHYIEILERKEAIRIYNIIVNNIKSENVQQISFPKLVSDINKNNEYLEKNKYEIPNDIIEQINKDQNVKLIEYTNLMSLLRQKQSDKQDEVTIKETIKTYLKNNKKNEVIMNKEIDKYIKEQDNYIDYIVEELPEKITERT